MQSVLCEGGRLDADRAGAELLYSERAGKKKLNEKRREEKRKRREGIFSVDDDDVIQATVAVRYFCT
jgi:hypothetical protein